MKLSIGKSILWVALGTLVLCSCNHEKQEKQQSAVRVETLTLTESTVTDGRSYSGVIEESSGTVLSFKIPGTLTKLAVSEGQFLSKGQLVAEVDASSLESNLRIAEATLATAQDTYDRMKILHDAAALPDMKWVEVQNALASAKSATQIAKNALNDTRIYAPFAGYVSQKIADLGSTVAPSMPVIKLVEISPVKINISVSEDEISSITDSTVANISVAAVGNLNVIGKLVDKGISADPLSRTYTVKFLVSNTDKKMLPGMLCSVTLSNEYSKQAMTLPVSSVLLDADNHSYVWINNNGKAQKRIVTLGAYTSDGVIIETGLEAGTEVIVKGMQKVSEGLPISPINK